MLRIVDFSLINRHPSKYEMYPLISKNISEPSKIKFFSEIVESFKCRIIIRRIDLGKR